MHKMIVTAIMLFLLSACSNAVESTETDIEASSYDEKPIVIFELTDKIFEMPKIEIPYYKNGEITFIEEETFAQHRAGHQPWLSAGIDVVTTAAANLTGENLPFIDSKLNYGDGIRTTESGIVIKEIDNEHIQLIVPSIGRYEIELRSPEPDSILFINKITLFPSDPHLLTE
jgi:hypothetical protein